MKTLKIDRDDAEMLIRSIVCFWAEGGIGEIEWGHARKLVDQINKLHSGLVDEIYDGILPGLLEEE